MSENAEKWRRIEALSRALEDAGEEQPQPQPSALPPQQTQNQQMLSSAILAMLVDKWGLQEERAGPLAQLVSFFLKFAFVVLLICSIVLLGFVGTSWYLYGNPVEPKLIEAIFPGLLELEPGKIIPERASEPPELPKGFIYYLEYNEDKSGGELFAIPKTVQRGKYPFEKVVAPPKEGQGAQKVEMDVWPEEHRSSISWQLAERVAEDLREGFRKEGEGEEELTKRIAEQIYADSEKEGWKWIVVDLRSPPEEPDSEEPQITVTIQNPDRDEDQDPQPRRVTPFPTSVVEPTVPPQQAPSNTPTPFPTSTPMPTPTPRPKPELTYTDSQGKVQRVTRSEAVQVLANDYLMREGADRSHSAEWYVDYAINVYAGELDPVIWGMIFREDPTPMPTSAFVTAPTVTPRPQPSPTPHVNPQYPTPVPGGFSPGSTVVCGSATGGNPNAGGVIYSASTYGGCLMFGGVDSGSGVARLRYVPEDDQPTSTYTFQSWQSATLVIDGTSFQVWVEGNKLYKDYGSGSISGLLPTIARMGGY